MWRCWLRCFSACSGGLRDLHSFPTRRSSDLELVAGTFDRIVDVTLGEPPRSPLLGVTPLGKPSERQPQLGGHQGPQSYKDRKSTRLNSSHPSISYAVFCLKKKNTNDDG